MTTALQLVGPVNETAPTSAAPTTDLERGLSLWLADVSAEATLAPLQERDPSEDPALSGPTPE